MADACSLWTRGWRWSSVPAWMHWCPVDSAHARWYPTCLAWCDMQNSHVSTFSKWRERTWKNRKRWKTRVHFEHVARDDEVVSWARRDVQSIQHMQKHNPCEWRDVKWRIHTWANSESQVRKTWRILEKRRKKYEKQMKNIKRENDRRGFTLNTWMTVKPCASINELVPSRFSTCESIVYVNGNVWIAKLTLGQMLKVRWEDMEKHGKWKNTCSLWRTKARWTTQDGSIPWCAIDLAHAKT